MSPGKSSGDRWIFARRSLPSAKVRLFCFPYGGGGASVYRRWQTAFCDDVEVCPVQLPGRENRFGEPAADNIDALLDTMIPALSPLFDRPVAFLGYCVGAGIAYRLAARCAERGEVDLRLLIGCARKAPPRAPTFDPLYGLSDTEFLDYVRSLGGTDPVIFEEPSLRELALRLMRTDLKLAASLVEPDDRRLTCRVVAVGGQDDASEPPEKLADWSRVTRGSFAMRLLPGNHFFIQKQSEHLLEIVRDELAPWL
jgi:surfactin synthase thioesterase subunit